MNHELIMKHDKMVRAAHVLILIFFYTHLRHSFINYYYYFTKIANCITVIIINKENTKAKRNKNQWKMSFFLAFFQEKTGVRRNFACVGRDFPVFLGENRWVG